MDAQGAPLSDTSTTIDRDVLIVGGGIGGLACALALAKAGFTSTVLERQDSFSSEGAGIQIGPNGSAVLAQLGVLERLLPESSRPEAISISDGRSGRELASLPLGDTIELHHGAPYLVAHRADLHAALVDAVRDEPNISLHMPVEIIAVREDGEAMVASDRAGYNWRSHAVAGADGLRSFVRYQYINRSPLRSAGKSAVRAIIPIGDVPDGIRSDVVGVWLHPGAHVVHYPIRNGGELAIVVVVEDGAALEGWALPADAVDIQNAVRNFARPVRSLIGSVLQWRKWGLYELPLPGRMVHGRVGLVGDAAHPILPFLAQGGVMALEDGLTFAQCFADNRSDVRAAFRSYEHIRLPRVRRVQAASKRNGQIYHLSGAFAAARDMTLRTLRSRQLSAQYDWLYGWSV